MRKLLAACSAIALFAIAPAMAQSNKGAKLVGIYDSSIPPKFVGTMSSFQDLVRVYNHTLYLLSYNRNGILKPPLFYFTTTNCTGQKYMYATNYSPDFAHFDGTTVWATVGTFPTQYTTVYSYDFGGEGGCPTTQETIPVLPAIDIEPNHVTATFVAPFVPHQAR